MKIVFLVGSYYPNYSAVSKCIHNIVKNLDGKYEIVIISDMNNEKYAKYEKIDNNHLYRIRTKRMNKRDLVETNVDKKNNLLEKISFILNNFFLRGIDYLKILFSYESYDKKLVNEYSIALNALDDVYAVIPTCYPYESIIASIDFSEKNTKTKVFPILFDKFSKSPTLHKFELNKKIKFRRHLNLEKKMVQNSDKIYYTEAWKDHFDFYFKNEENLIQIGHPLVEKIKTTGFSEKNKSKKNYFIYTGVLDKKVRSPKKVLDFFEYAIKQNNNNILEIYSIGNCNKYINKAVQKQKDNIFNNGYVKSEIAYIKQKNSDFLVSIGNSDISLIPSKIYEYLSLGKPIIHFYKDLNDPIIDILKDYNNSLIINEDDIAVNKINDLYIVFNRFISKNKYKEVDYNEVENMFSECTPKFVANLIKKNF